MKRFIANRWRPVFLLLPRRTVIPNSMGDEVEVRWIWGKAFLRYSVFQGRFMGIIYSKTNK